MILRSHDLLEQNFRLASDVTVHAILFMILLSITSFSGFGLELGCHFSCLYPLIGSQFKTFCGTHLD